MSEDRPVILVDSTVWMDYFRSADTPQVGLLDSYFGSTRLAVGDLIAAEVLQGVRDEREFKLVRKTLDAFEHIDLAPWSRLHDSKNSRHARCHLLHRERFEV